MRFKPQFKLKIISILLFILLPLLLKGQGQLDNFLVTAKLYFNTHDYDEALVNIDSAISKMPTSEAYWLKAKILKDRSDLENAIQAYSQGIELNKSNAEAYFERGWLYYLAKYHRNFALNDLDKSLALDRTDPLKYYRRSFLRANTENPQTGTPDFALATDDLTQAIRMSPNNAKYYSERGEYRFAIDEKLGALSDLNKAVEIDDQNAEYIGSRGLIKLLMEDYNGAGQDLTIAIRLDPQNPNFLSNRAHASYNLGNYTRAVTDYTRSIILMIKNAERISSGPALKKMSKELRSIYLIRGSAFIQLNRNGEACDDFQRSRDLGERRAFNYIRRYCGG